MGGGLYSYHGMKCFKTRHAYVFVKTKSRLLCATDNHSLTMTVKQSRSCGTTIYVVRDIRNINPERISPTTLLCRQRISTKGLKQTDRQTHTHRSLATLLLCVAREAYIPRQTFFNKVLRALTSLGDSWSRRNSHWYSTQVSSLS